MLEKLTAENAAVQALQMRGIGTITAATMIAEIIDIRRFAREDSLACYAGLGMREHSTGQTTNMVPTKLFNHRLKDAFITAARNVVFSNPDSHLSGGPQKSGESGNVFADGNEECCADIGTSHLPQALRTTINCGDRGCTDGG
jgi:hypothetical protein